MMMRRQRHQAGFTLIEAMVASMILGMAAVTLCTLSTKSLAQTKLNREYELAWQVLDRQLTMLDYMSIDEFVLLGEREGFTDDFGKRYHWQIEVAEEPLDVLYMVQIDVWWQEGQRVRRITAATMLNGQSTVTLTGDMPT